MKPTETAQVEFIKDCLRKGEKRKSILGKFGKKWAKISRTTFDRRLGLATAAISAEIKEIEAKAKEGMAKKAEVAMERILSVTQRQELLTLLALGKVKVEKPVWTAKGVRNLKCEPDHGDRIRAIGELNKMGGDYGATKSYLLGDEDQPLSVAVSEESNIDYEKLPLEVLEALLHAKKEKAH